jgi:hypothetical protein
MAFELASQTVALWGLDLPALMPDTAALPAARLPPSLADDVEAARGAAAAPGAGPAEQGAEGGQGVPSRGNQHPHFHPRKHAS